MAFFEASDELEIRETWLPVLKAQIPTTLEAHTLPGTHMSCVTEQVAALEQRLSYSLRRVQKTQQRHDETHKKTVTGEGAHALHNN